MAPRIVSTPSPIDAAAELLAAAIAGADAARGAARVAIPGGSALAALGPARARLPAGTWARVLLTWVDERCVDLADAASNRGTAHRSGALDPGAPVALELALREDGESVSASIARVDRVLRGRFEGALDVTLLGMGEDGHVASLFPGHAALDGLVAHVEGSPKPPRERLTLTRPFLATASSAILLATGEGKRAALARLLAGDASLPAHGLPGLTIVTDLEGVEPRRNEPA